MAKLNMKTKAIRVWETCKSFLAKYWRWVAAITVLLLVTLGLILAGYKSEWTGFGDYKGSVVRPRNRAKSLWDWLELLIVPLVLAVGAALFTWVTDRRAREIEQDRLEEQRNIESDRSRDVALETYLRRVSSLLRSEWRESGEGFLEADIIRAQTLTVLRQLDGARKGLLLQFLYDSGLIGKWVEGRGSQVAIVDLSRADLTQANLVAAKLSGVALSGADLSHANLREADLTRANLREATARKANLSLADLSCADFSQTTLREANLNLAKVMDASLANARLSGAQLRGANLEKASLEGANLEEANLEETILKRTNLEGAKVTDEQLAQVGNLEGATLPDGTVHE